ncbi:MAG: ribosome silencing factor [Chloroflexi bacterium]|nr:ribosome silencing factor [Chloroflexota bacterium]
MARTLVDVLEDKKGEAILLLDLIDIAPFTDYFVICSGTSNRMLQALMDAAQREIRNRYNLRTKIEGAPQDGWMLADFGDIVLHIFSPDQREYYQLEKLWTRGKILLHVQ